MRKTRRIVALVLVLTFIFAFTAMSASAANITKCSRCGDRHFTDTYVRTTTTPVSVSSCDQINGSHYHIQRETIYRFKCSYCGFSYEYVKSSNTTCG